MISFRARGPESLEWDDISVAGENEELLAHQIASLLEHAGWEFVSARDGEEFEELDWEDEEDS